MNCLADAMLCRLSTECQLALQPEEGGDALFSARMSRRLLERDAGLSAYDGAVSADMLDPLDADQEMDWGSWVADYLTKYDKAKRCDLRY